MIFSLDILPTSGATLHAMAHYTGLQAIAARLNVNRSTVVRWKHELGFLMYPRRRQWYTNDDLIHAWEMARAHAATHAMPRVAAGLKRYRSQAASTQHKPADAP